MANPRDCEALGTGIRCLNGYLCLPHRKLERAGFRSKCLRAEVSPASHKQHMQQLQIKHINVHFCLCVVLYRARHLKQLLSFECSLAGQVTGITSVRSFAKLFHRRRLLLHHSKTLTTESYQTTSTSPAL